jgi:hypothetical protein
MALQILVVVAVELVEMTLELAPLEELAGLAS